MSFQNLLIAFALLCGSALGQIQRVTLYEQFNQFGNTITFDQEYASDLTPFNFNNKARSVCVTGVWIFYEDPNFNPNAGRRAEYVYGKNNYCVNLLTVEGRISSLKYAGHPKDYTIDSLTIYEHVFFQGGEEYTYNEIANLPTFNKNNQSVIVTGNSDWTVYELPNFKGRSVCLRVPNPENSVPAFIADLQKSVSQKIPHGRIQSVRKGCTSDQTIEMKAFEEDYPKSF